MKCGLLGRKLGHSYSPQIHNLLGDYSYVLFEKEPDELENFLKNGDFSGLNVTIPYKKEVIPYLSELSPTAKKMGCVNTILRRSDGTLYGHNTDYFGFTSLVRHAGLSVAGKKVLVLGSGGASNTAVAALKDLGASPVVISRSGENNYGNLHLHRDAAAIVNATPVGMYPNTGVSPIDLGLFPHLEGVLDVIYNPARTQLLLDAEKLGIPRENGLWMLVAQAKEAAEVFTGRKISDEVIEKIYRRLSHQMKNIVLIGMPSCGKTTVGRILAEKCGKQLADTDEYIVRKIGMPISDFFAKHGEAEFRKIEKETVAELSATGGRIIATGGGAVLDPENVRALKQNGVLVFLDRRPENLIATDDRPLASRRSALEKLYAERYDIYYAAAELHIDANTTPEAEADAILKELAK